MSIFNFYQQLQLTSDQRTTLESIESFLKGDEKVFLLKGYAGTGKTTLVKGICRYLASMHSDFKLMAPTGRAAMILSQKTGIQASTIHRGIYNMDQILEKEEGTSFRFYYGLKLNEESTRCVYLVDEASMISDVFSDDEFFTFGSGCLLKDLINYSLIGDTQRRVIFVGDEAQLPPVNMNFSPALDSHYISDNYHCKVKETTLSEVVRQAKDSGVLESATRIRNAIAKNIFNSFEISYNQADTHKLLPEAFLEHYASVAKKGGVEQTVVITHSNRLALEYNQQIRSLRYNTTSPQIQRKDWLIITKNNYNGPVELFNGMFVTVLEVGGISYEAKPRFIVEGGRTIERKLVFRDVLIEVGEVNGTKHQLNTTILDNFLNAEESRLHPYDQRALYIEFKERMRKLKINPGSNEFRKALKNDRYFNVLQAKYGYAITCHKSQGGEWENVFVDFKVFMGKFSKSFFRWAYTAVTRSNQRLFCIDAPHYNALSHYVVRDIEKIANVMAGSVYFPKRENDPKYFVQHRKNRLQEICSKEGISIEFKEPNYQLEIIFQQSENKGKVQLWFSDSGFTKSTWHEFTNEEFKSLIKSVLIESLLPTDIPFEPKFEFQKALHAYFLELLAEENIPVTNIIQNQWNDQYFLQTEATCSMVEFVFNGKHQYSFARPRSTDGSADLKLLSVVNKLRGIS